jgi:hypothetical protein
MEEDKCDDRYVKLVVSEFQLLDVHERKRPAMLLLSQAKHPFGVVDPEDDRSR